MHDDVHQMSREVCLKELGKEKTFLLTSPPKKNTKKTNIKPPQF